MADFEGGIDQGQTLSRSIDLSGDSVRNQLTLRIHGAVPVSFVAGGSDNFAATSSFPTGMTVVAAQAESPAITKDLSQTIELSDSSVIDQAVIESGQLSLQIVNGTSMPADLTLRIPNFTDGSDTLSIAESFIGAGSIDRDIDLAGYTFRPSGTGNPQTVDMVVTANIPASAPAQRVFTSSDSLHVSAAISTITFASVSGQVKPTRIDIEPIESDVDLPEGIGEARLTHAALNLTLYNNSTADVDVDLTMEDETQTRQLALAGRIQGKDDIADPPRATVLTLDADSLSGFLDPAPSRITIIGEAIFNPDEEIITITRDDFFYGDVEITSPLAFFLADTVRVDLDANETDVNQDDLPDLEETFGYGKITAVLANRLPIGARVALYISTRSDSTMFDDPDALVIGPFTLESALTDINGFAIEEVTSTFEDSLDSQQILIFDNDVVYIAPKVELMPTSSAGSYIQGSDYIGIRATARIKVNVNENAWDGNN